jgi:hypothetical protein
MNFAKRLILLVVPMMVLALSATSAQAGTLPLCNKNLQGCMVTQLEGASACEHRAGNAGNYTVYWCCDPGEVINDEFTGCIDGSLQNPVESLDNETFDYFNPLKRYADAEVADQLSTPGGVISRALVFAFPLAGIILFVMLTWAGFEIVAGGGSKKAQDAGKQRATAAVIGFVLLFVSYWIVQVVEVVLNVAIL